MTWGDFVAQPEIAGLATLAVVAVAVIAVLLLKPDADVHILT